MKTIEAKKAVYKTKNLHWFGGMYNLNIYKGCNHGCIYCDSRSSCYQVVDFDTVRVKDNIVHLVERDLKSFKTKGVINLGAMSDNYNPYEQEYKYTRSILQVINNNYFGLNLSTKSDLVVRDIDLFKQINKHSAVLIGLTITTADDLLSSRIERNCSAPTNRFKALKELSDAGLYTGVLLMPILPFINDTEENIRSIVEKSYEAGVKYIYPFFGVTLRDNQREYFFDVIGEELKNKYISTFKESYSCSSLHSKKLYKLFETLCRKYNIVYKMEDIIKESKKYVSIKQETLF